MGIQKKQFFTFPSRISIFTQPEVLSSNLFIYFSTAASLMSVPKKFVNLDKSGDIVNDLKLFLDYKEHNEFKPTIICLR
jgi:hypothetical protein